MRVAFLGLGIMGSRMAANLARSGFELTVWNRTESKAREFAQRHRAEIAATPAEAVADSEAVVTMLVDGHQVQEVLLAASPSAGMLCIDCSTIGPQASREIAAALPAVRLIDAPVTGSAPRAEDGTLTIMVGAGQEDFERARPILEAMGELIVHVGPPGHGQMVKLINNTVAASNAAVLGEALLVGAKAGVDLDALSQVMGAGSGASAMLELKAEPMRRHDYATLFKLEHMLKDVRLCLEEGQRLGVPFPFGALTHQILTAAMGRGHGQDDFAALIEPLQDAAGIRF
jgi:3-hydroxyisobutyrate dehydrogenase-like beta-hydroxyacid dehydrogenase